MERYLQWFVLAGWALALCAIASVVRHSRSEFAAAGRSRSKWFWINVLGLVPYLGLIVPVIYWLSVSTAFPERPTRTRRPANWSSNGQGPSRGRGSSGGPSGTPINQPPQRQPCTCSGGKVPCYGCQAGWDHTGSGPPQPHIACGGKGTLTCQMCLGRGYR